MKEKRKYVTMLTLLILLSATSYVQAAAEVPEGHTFLGWVTVRTADCETDGLRTNTCRYCGMVVEDVTPALGHDWKLTGRQEPTCTDGGSQSFVCGRCGKTKTEILPPLGHDFVESVIEPTCTAEGRRIETCTRCGEVQVVENLPALGHELVINEIQPTAAEGGMRITTCTRCDYRQVETLPALGEAAPTDVPENTAQKEEIAPQPLAASTGQVPVHSTEPWKPNTMDYVLGGSCCFVSVAGFLAIKPFLSVFKWYKQKRIIAIKKLFGG